MKMKWNGTKIQAGCIKSQEDFENQSEEEGAELYCRIEAGILEVYDVDEDTLEELFNEILGQ